MRYLVRFWLKHARTIREPTRLYIALLLTLIAAWFWINANLSPLSNNVIDKKQCTSSGTVKVKKITSKYPAIVWATDFANEETVVCSVDTICSVYKPNNNPDDVKAYLFYASALNFSNLPIPRKPDVTWGLLHDESPINVDLLMYEKILSLFNYSCTFSRHSDVPFPLLNMGPLDNITSLEYFVDTTVKNVLLGSISPILYLQSHCDTSTERDEYVKELMKLIPVDSYGACLNNKELPNNLVSDYVNHLNDDSFLRFVARYKFVIAIENGVCDDYVTEKFWRAIRVGSVPIYFGSPSIRDWFPNNKSAILLEDFPTPKLLSEHIKKLLQNDILYEEYLQHKIKGVITNRRLVDELRRRPYQTSIDDLLKQFYCFICTKINEKAEKHEVNIVKKSHYNCPKPVSALTLGVNPSNYWVQSWDSLQIDAENVYYQVLGDK